MRRQTYLYAEQSEHINELAEAHSLALGKMRNAARKSKSHFGPYADLGTLIDTIRIPFSEHGLSFIQTFIPYGDHGTLALATTMAHKSGQFIRSVVPMNSDLKPQQLAASATYFRRMALAAIAGVAADHDDDGEGAQSAEVVARVNEEMRIKNILVKKLKASKTAEEGAAVLKRAMKGVKEEMLSQDAYKQIEDVAAGMSWPAEPVGAGTADESAG